MDIQSKVLFLVVAQFQLIMATRLEWILKVQTFSNHGPVFQSQYHRQCQIMDSLCSWCNYWRHQLTQVI